MEQKIFGCQCVCQGRKQQQDCSSWVWDFKYTYFDNHLYILDDIREKFTYFKGEFGTKVLAYGFIFDFTGNGNMTVVNKVENEINKDWFNASLKKYKPNVIALIGHIGLHFNEFKITMEAIRKVYPTVPIAVMGGHT